jgi:hypothetical protein
MSGWGFLWQAVLSTDPPLDGSTQYTLSVSTSLRDIFGRPLDKDYRIVFGTVDTDPPTVALVSPANGSWIRPGTPIVVKVVEVRLEEVMVEGNFTNETFKGSEVTIPTDAWPDGPAHVMVTAVDLAGNTAVAAFVFYVDGTPPVISSLSPSNGSYLGPEAIVEVTVDDLAVSAIRFETSWMCWTENGDRLATPTMDWPEGTVNGTLIAVDRAGNEAVLPVMYIVDRTSPSIRLLGPIENSVIGQGATVEVSITDDSPLVCTYRSGDGGWRGIDRMADGRAFLKAEGIEEGPLPITVRGTDKAGNVGILYCWYWFDVKPPLITFSTSRPGTVLGKGDIIEVHVEDASLERLTVSLDGKGLHEGPSTLFLLPLVQLTDGYHCLAAVATDAAGHRSEATFAFIRDGTPPGVDIQVPGHGPFFAPSSSIKVTVVEANGPVSRVSLDNGTELLFTGTEFQVALLELSHGWHRMRVHAEDSASNAADSQLDLMVDDAVPRITFADLVAGERLSPGASVLVRIEDDLDVRSEYRIDDGPWEMLGIGSRIVLPSNLTDSRHELTVRSTDLVGNTGNADVAFVISIGGTPSPVQPPLVHMVIIIVIATVSGIALWRWKRAKRGD